MPRSKETLEVLENHIKKLKLRTWFRGVMLNHENPDDLAGQPIVPGDRSKYPYKCPLCSVKLTTSYVKKSRADIKLLNAKELKAHQKQHEQRHEGYKLHKPALLHLDNI